MTSNILRKAVQFEYRRPQRNIESIDHVEGVDVMDETYYGKFITITADMALVAISSFPNYLELRDSVMWIHNGHPTDILTISNPGGVINGGAQVVPGATIFVSRGSTFSSYDVMGGV